MTARAAGIAWLALLCACGAEPVDPGQPAEAAPLSIRGTAWLSPERLQVGDLAVVELAVVTPPDHSLRAVRPPESVPGFWLLDAGALPVEKQAQRWTHRHQIRLRAREPGAHSWPAQSVEVEDRTGQVTTLELAAQPVEVASALSLAPDRIAPFGLREPAAPLPVLGDGTSALLGACAALSAVALFQLTRWLRRRRRDADAQPREGHPWEEARAALARAREQLAQDPEVAADVAAFALRRYVARRFDADIEAHTTEELEALPAPYTWRSRWPDFLALLRELDDLRFPPPGDISDREQRVAAALQRGETVVEDSVPREQRQP